jgi:hypothetical protein
MGQNFTKGAIVQHLAKIRQRMVETNVRVPPAPRRGAVTVEPSSKCGPKGRKAIAPLALKNKRTNEPSVRRPVKVRGRRKKRTMSESDDELDTYSYADSGSEYEQSQRKARISGGNKRRKGLRSAFFEDMEFQKDQRGPGQNRVSPLASPKVETPTIKGESVVPSIEDSAEQPATHARGFKQDYSQLEGDEGDELEDEKVDEGDQVFGDGLGNGEPDATWRADEGDYSPRNITNMISSSANILASNHKSNSIPLLTETETDTHVNHVRPHAQQRTYQNGQPIFLHWSHLEH